MIRFPRTELARQLVRALKGQAIFGDAQNGLFLAAPRRTGKSTFLKEDLAPALIAAGAVVVYVDLWSATQRDRAELLTRAIGEALRSHLGSVARAAREVGVSKVSLKGFIEIDPGKIGALDGATIPEALRTLEKATGRTIALIVDEAQHALASEAGEDAMKALKSARDQMNSPDRIRLMLVMSGSDRDKLLRLVANAAAPFFGSRIHQMPLLGEDFIRFIKTRIEAQLPQLTPVDEAALKSAFESFGSRPQFFMDAIGRLLSPLSGDKGRLEKLLVREARARQEEDRAQMAREYLALKPIEQAVLWRLLEQGGKYRAFDSEALRFYSRVIGEKKVAVARVQRALEALRSHEPPLLWKSAHGEYALEDTAMNEWYQELVSRSEWPPKSVS